MQLLARLSGASVPLSLVLCALVMPLRLPGMSLFGLAPNWLLIWVVAWSLNRPIAIATISGAAAGLVQDAMTLPGDGTPAPTHTIGLAIAGALTALLQKQRYLQEDFISVALITFGMTVVAETAIAVQLTLQGNSLQLVWTLQQRITLASAVLSSLWSPVLYFPLSRLWQEPPRDL